VQYHPEKGIVFCLIAGWSKGSSFGEGKGREITLYFSYQFSLSGIIYLLGLKKNKTLAGHLILRCYLGGGTDFWKSRFLVSGSVLKLLISREMV
jgi:hypothetical protein